MSIPPTPPPPYDAVGHLPDDGHRDRGFPDAGAWWARASSLMLFGSACVWSGRSLASVWEGPLSFFFDAGLQYIGLELGYGVVQLVVPRLAALAIPPVVLLAACKSTGLF